jgi:hypothetical protein
LLLLDLDTKRLHVLHRMRHGASGAEFAVAEQVIARVRSSDGANPFRRRPMLKGHPIACVA